MQAETLPKDENRAKSHRNQLAPTSSVANWENKSAEGFFLTKAQRTQPIMNHDVVFWITK